jgi:hypothetical protein
MDPLGFAIALDEIYVETSGSRARSAQEDHVIVIGFAQDGFMCNSITTSTCSSDV